MPLLPFCLSTFKQLTQCADKIFIGQWLSYSKRGECQECHFSFFVIRDNLQHAVRLVTFTEPKKEKWEK